MFEIHITTHSLEEDELQEFVAFCRRIQAKPILIELNEGIQAQQPMISKVIRTTDKEELYEAMYQLGYAFEEAGYPVYRTKVEVPLEYMKEGEEAFPNFKGKYFEWHGKVRFRDFDHLKEIAEKFEAHLSQNSLKGEKDRRFLTIRTYGYVKSFEMKVHILKNGLNSHGYILAKDEYEYCVYDSNKAVDNGWIDTPDITDHMYINLLAYESFLRRVSRWPNDAFMLKGSLVTRQYLPDKRIRKPADLDFVYMGKEQDPSVVGRIFSEWVTRITETQVNDGVTYDSFSLNDFWRGIDYAMNDDFPTVNTDLSCVVRGEYEPYISLDISWNLPFDEEATSMTYVPDSGDPFYLPYTVPLVLQISWKLHQCLVRPRQKDMLDIILMIENGELGAGDVERIAFHLVKECEKDDIPAYRLRHYINGEAFSFFQDNEKRIRHNWEDYVRPRTPFGFTFDNAFENIQPNTFSLSVAMPIPELLKKFEESLNLIEIAHFIPQLPEDYKPYQTEEKGDDHEQGGKKWWEIWK